MSLKAVHFSAVVLAVVVVLAALAVGGWQMLNGPSAPPEVAATRIESLPAEPEAREEAAQRLLDEAHQAASRSDWGAVTARLEQLVADYAYTSVYMLNREAIATLRATAERGGVRQARPPVAEPSPPESRKPRKRKRKEPLTFTGGKLTIQAEDPDRLVEPMEIGEDGRASGNQFVWEPRKPGREQFSERDARVVYYVRCDQDRQVSIYARVRARSDDENSLLLAVEPGRKTTGALKEWHFAPKPVWVWAPFGVGTRADRTATKATPVQLREGTNSIIIAVRERNTALDCIRLTEREE